MRIVIIGLGAAGFAAALAAKKYDRKAEIVFIDKKDFDLLHHCGLPFYIEGKVKNIGELKQNIGLDRMGIKKYAGYEAVSIDGGKKELEIRNLKKNSKEKVKYDSLIIATGAEPFIPSIKGAELAYAVDTIESAEKIKKNAKKGKNAVVIGAGAIGLETGFALKENGLKVKIVDILPRTLPKVIDEDICGILEDYLKSIGVDLLFNKKIKEIKKGKVILNDGEIKADIVIMATGVRANTEIAKKSGIKTGKFGIIVDEKLKTNLKDVYAAGDCVESVSLVNKKTFVAQLASTASNQGIVAGINAADGKAVYEGALGTFASKIGSLEVAATGFNSSYAEENGYDVLIGKAKAAVKPEWFPKSNKLTLKIVADGKNGKVLGGQAIGEQGAAERINIIAAAIKAGFTLKDLVELELAYCPALSDVKDVILMAAEFGLRRYNQK
jgi:NADH oxidase (H2O2-forming)